MLKLIASLVGHEIFLWLIQNTQIQLRPSIMKMEIQTVVEDFNKNYNNTINKNEQQETSNVCESIW
jgi:hypothetical protein